MDNLSHPAALNVFRQYRQATALFSSTSRARNPGWYLEALAHDFQVHLRPDGATLTAVSFDRRNNCWTTLPSPDGEVLRDPLHAQSWALELLEQARKAGAKSLGVILHMADEFATAELKPDFTDPEVLPDLRDAAIHDPASILSDTSISPEHNSWRVIPYPGARGEGIGTAISISRAHDEFLSQLRNAGQHANFPVTTQAVSAPLVALTALPQSVALAEGQPFVTILQYPWFTALGFFNGQGNLLLIRTQIHRGQRRPPNFRHAISTTNASLELQDPDLFIFPLGEHIDEALVADLQTTFPSSRVELVKPPAVAGLPAWCPEPAIAACPPDADETLSRTFQILRTEGWAFQDFLPAAREQVELFPSRGEMRLLTVARFARVAMLVITLLAIGWSAVSLIATVSKPEWSFDPANATATKSRLAKLNIEKTEIAHLDNLLEDRAKAWTSMELLARLIPENQGIRVKTLVHTVRPDTVPGQAKVGFVKEWKIAGVTRAEGMEYLQTLNSRDGVAAHFEQVAITTGDTTFDLSLGNRTMVPNLRTQENPGFRQRPAEEISDLDDTTYPLTFDLTITQRFEATDPLALNVSKAVTSKAVTSKSTLSPSLANAKP